MVRERRGSSVNGSTRRALYALVAMATLGLLAPVIAAFAQEHCSQRFSHRGLAHSLFIATAMQRLARGIKAEGDKIILDPRHKAQRRGIVERRTEGLGNRALDPFAGGPRVIDFRFATGHLDP